MTSAYLDKPTRSRADVISGILANERQTYIIVALEGAGLCLCETPLGQTKSAVVIDIADGQHPTAVAVLRICSSDLPQNVSEDIARAVIDYLDKSDRLFDPGDLEPRAPSFVYDAWDQAEDAIAELRAAIIHEREHVATERHFARIT